MEKEKPKTSPNEACESLKPGALFLSSDKMSENPNSVRHWVIHRLKSGDFAHACWDDVGTDADVIVEFYTADCGRFAKSGGAVTANFEDEFGFSIDSLEKAKQYKAVFCPECFPEASLKPENLVCPICSALGKCSHKKDINPISTRYTDSYRFECESCGYSDSVEVDGGEAGFNDSDTKCPYCGE